jgi:peptidoglycan hydrolase-like protein with peptidoglycan-binding domain
MSSRLGRVLATALAVGIVASISFWAGASVFVPPQLPLADPGERIYQVGIGTVERSLQVTVAASWPVRRTTAAVRDGVVTTVDHASGGLAMNGDVVATVDLVPVVIAEGAIPMFRTLELGVEGPDVAQLQQLLVALGFGSESVNGRFDDETRRAVIRWQRSLKTSSDGVVEDGTLVFLDVVPIRLSVLPQVGERIHPGAGLLEVLDHRPSFVMTAPAWQRAEIASGQEILITAPSGSIWRGSIGPFTPADDGRIAAAILGDPCLEDCGELDIEGETILRATIPRVPPTTGVLVPSSALVLLPSGDRAVVSPDGSSLRVRVVAEADGLAIVDGVSVGSRILLPELPQP